MNWRERQTAFEALLSIYYDDLESELHAESDFRAELEFDDWEDLLRPTTVSDMRIQIGSDPGVAELDEMRFNQVVVAQRQRELDELYAAMWNSEEFENKRASARKAAEVRARWETWRS